MENTKRRLHVRSLLKQAKNASSDELAGNYAEQAGDILLTFLAKPFCASRVYHYATQKLQNPVKLLRALDEMGWMFGTKQKIIDEAIENLAETRPDIETFQERVKNYLPRLINDGDLRDAVLSALRSRERFDHIVLMLSECAKEAKSTHRRHILLSLGHALRFGRGDLPAAASVFEQLVALDPNDREAWGELLECLDDSGDDQGLVDALSRRIILTNGLEREQLEKRYQSRNA